MSELSRRRWIGVGRWLAVRAAVLLGLGVATTVAIAWGLVLILDSTKGTDYGRSTEFADGSNLMWVGVATIGADRRAIEYTARSDRFAAKASYPAGQWLRHMVARWNRAGVFDQQKSRSPAPWGRLPGAMRGDAADLLRATEAPYEVACGWPRLALWCPVRADGYSRQRQADWPLIPLGGLHVFEQQATHISDARILPMRPLWPGFIANTAVFAGGWGAVLFAPGLVRSALRRRRGRCGRCGYDLRGLSAGVCPECGLTCAV